MRFLILAILATSVYAVPFRYRHYNDRIVGGQTASQGQFPYQLSLQDTTYGSGFHYCGASIYNEFTMICAAHCVQTEDVDNPQNLQIVAGEENIFEDSGLEQARKVTRIIIHEDFDPGYMFNDISLLFVKEGLSFNGNVNGIPLYGEKDKSDITGIVSGWGNLGSDGPNPENLQYVEIPVVSDESCQQNYLIDTILPSMMCAGEEGKDSCQGDSGGPLACDGKLCGVVSWGRGCGKPRFPGVYTEIAYFKDWIENNAVSGP